MATPEPTPKPTPKPTSPSIDEADEPVGDLGIISYYYYYGEH
jgi:hypothetical protein